MTNPAEGYERYMVPTLFDPWAARLIQTAAPKPGERVLDVGCGTGVVARRIAAQLAGGGAVTGLDPSADMLTVARSAAAREGVDVDWRHGRAEQLPFPDGSFDLVTCQFALMFVADRPAALAQMRRVVDRSGRMVASVWQGLDRHPFYRTLHQVIEQRLGVSALQDIFSLGRADELLKMALTAGFVQADVEPISMTARFPNPDGFLAGEIDVDTAAIPSMQHLDAQARQEMVTAIADAMRAPLAEVTQDDHVVIEFHASMLCARP